MRCILPLIPFGSFSKNTILSGTFKSAACRCRACSTRFRMRCPFYWSLRSLAPSSIINLVADKGYHSGQAVMALEQVEVRSPALPRGESTTLRGLQLFVLQFSFVLHSILRICLISHKIRERVLYSRPAHFSPVMPAFALDSRSGARGQKCQTVATYRGVWPQNVSTLRLVGHDVFGQRRYSRDNCVNFGLRYA